LCTSAPHSRIAAFRDLALLLFAFLRLILCCDATTGRNEFFEFRQLPRAVLNFCVLCSSLDTDPLTADCALQGRQSISPHTTRCTVRYGMIPDESRHTWRKQVVGTLPRRSHDPRRETPLLNKTSGFSTAKSAPVAWMEGTNDRCTQRLMLLIMLFFSCSCFAYRAL